MRGVRLRVGGPYALFARQDLKVERETYPVMTPSAARGVMESIHWKPAIVWVVDRIRVLTPIRTTTIRRNEVGRKAPAGTVRAAMNRGDIGDLHLLVEDERQQRAATVLVNPDYLIEAHFVLTDRAGPDDTEGKHLDIFNRRATRGQCWQQPCLGTREFPAEFAPVPHGEPLPMAAPKHRTADLGFGTPRDLGLMLWDIDHGAPGRPSLLFRARLVDGVMAVPQPGSPEILR
ncbi:MAG: type I-C CRISPR-associated protein Cas5c [Amaricoccus sp.]|uniref:type I-C CRISPR-associated protein Cas5c n=1 Tax=Amaricoccus sp. TaxID=1872485 RepID=UPI0039E5EA5A